MTSPRAFQAFRKMKSGTIGGQSRVATPVNTLGLYKPIGSAPLLADAIEPPAPTECVFSYDSTWTGDTDAHSISAFVGDMDYEEGDLLLNFHFWWYDSLLGSTDYLEEDGYGGAENGWEQHVDDSWIITGNIVGHAEVFSAIGITEATNILFGWEGDAVHTITPSMALHCVGSVTEVEHSSAGEAGPVAVASLSHQVTSLTGDYCVVFVVSDSGIDSVPDGAEDVLLADIGEGQELRVLLYSEGTPLVELESGGGLIRYVAYVVLEGSA